MRDDLGTPIMYDALHRGWHYTEPGFSLASQELSEGTRSALKSAQRSLALLIASSLGCDAESVIRLLSTLIAPPLHGGDVVTMLPETCPTPHTSTPALAFEVSLLFTGRAASVVSGHTWRGDQRTELLSDGTVRLHLTTPLTSDLERWVLGWGDEVVVEAPRELVAVIVGRLRRALRRHALASLRPPPRASGTLTQGDLEFETLPEDDGRSPVSSIAGRPREPVQSDLGFQDRSPTRGRTKTTNRR
jgi:hypothetical protein